MNQRYHDRQRNKGLRRQRGFTLLELILSLTLTAVVAAMIGSLVQLFLVNQNTGRDQVRQAQLARAILNMITDDIRTTVRYQPFDSSGLSQLISGGAGGGGGGASAADPAASSGVGGGAATPATGASGGGGASAAAAGTEVVSLPPGLYGTSTSIEIDISRLPRPDEYFAQGSNMMTGTLGDLPSDIKTIGYYVQALRTDGVNDPLAGLTDASRSQQAPAITGSGGLVRRSLDRAVTQFAYEQAQTDSLLKTGELLAPEVIALEFEYYDGAMWQQQWDSSVQGLPRVVKVTIAMQRESTIKTKPLDPGIAISTLTTAMMQEYGIDIYSTNTIIPGSQLLVAPQGTTGTGGDTGMSSMGLP